MLWETCLRNLERVSKLFLQKPQVPGSSLSSLYLLLPMIGNDVTSSRFCLGLTFCRMCRSIYTTCLLLFMQSMLFMFLMNVLHWNDDFMFIMKNKHNYWCFPSITNLRTSSFRWIVKKSAVPFPAFLLYRQYCWRLRRSKTEKNIWDILEYVCDK